MKMSDEVKKFLVETILFDDIIAYLPKSKNGSFIYTDMKIKIDIENFEPYALQSAQKLFQTFNIIVIFMEWYTIWIQIFIIFAEKI